MDTSADQLRLRVLALVADWVATLFRPYPSAADLDRLVESVVAVVTGALAERDAQLGRLAAAVEQAGRELHGEQGHPGSFGDCPKPPCAPLLRALAQGS